MTESEPNASHHAVATTHRRMLLTLGAAFAIVAVLTIQHFLLKNRADRLLVELRAQGHPTDLDQVNESYAIPPGVTNAADIYMPAFTALIPEDGSNTNAPVHFSLESPIDAYPDNILRYVRNWMETNATVIPRLHEAAGHPHCRYPQDYTLGYNTLLPHLSQAKNAIRILGWNACLLAESGKIDPALDSIQAAISISDSLDGEPDIIGQLVRIAGYAIVCNRLEEILNRRRLSDADLKRLFRLLEGRESTKSLQAAFAGEMCMGLYFFENPDAFGGLNFNGVTTAGDNFKSLAAISGLKATGLWERDRAFYIGFHQGCMETLDNPFPEALSAAAEVNARLEGASKGIRNVVTRAIAPALTKVIERKAMRVATLRVTLAGVAVERYRLANDGRPPDSLSDLVPEFLPSTLDDPFDGHALRYRRLDTGYVIWSVGADLQDQQGDLEPEGKRALDRRFRMFR